MSHTILLIQPGNNPQTRTFSDYETVSDCITQGVIKMYEENLKRRNPHSAVISYNVSQLFDFIDELADLSCLVYQRGTNSYAPHNKEWIKEKIFLLMKEEASANL